MATEGVPDNKYSWSLLNESSPTADAEQPPPPAGATLRRGSTVAATDYERVAVDRCLKAVEVQVRKRVAEGLNTRNFFLGVVNSHVVVFVFAGYPQYFWILYMVQTFVLFPIRFYRMFKAVPLRTTRYMLDFCWVGNIIGNLMLLAVIVDAYRRGEWFGDDVRRLCFCAFYGIANGPLLLATGFLGNALVFHDMDNTVSMFIHIFPPLLMYTFRWRSDVVHGAWPQLFELDYFDTVRPGDIYLLGLACYGGWWLLYTLWLLSCGMHLPHSGIDTVFHWAVRGPAGPVVCKLTGRSHAEFKERARKNDFFASEALAYLLVHAVAVSLALTLGVANFYFQPLHTATLVAMVLIAVYNGAARYTHFLLRSYGDIIRRELGIQE